MNIFYLSVTASFSIVIAVIIGLIRFEKVIRTYRPFLLVCFLALVNEIISTIAAYRFGTNAVNANIYVLLECLLFTWQFYRWRPVSRIGWEYLAIGIMSIVIWMADNFVLNSIFDFNSLFRCFYSFSLIFLSIQQINRLIIQANTNLIRDACFLICIGVIIFYSYKATIEVFYLLKLQFSVQFYNRVYFILLFVNVFVNLIYAIAALWMPTKQKLIMPY